MKISFDFDPATKAVTNVTVDGAGAPAPTPAPTLPMFVDLGDGTLRLAKTGHVVPKPQPQNGEMLVGYFQRVATALGSNPQIAGSIFSLGLGSGSRYDVSSTGDPTIDWPLNLDSFANPAAYGTGDAGGDFSGSATVIETLSFDGNNRAAVGPIPDGKRVAYFMPAGGMVAVAIDIPTGQFADQTFRASAAEYGSPPCQYEIGFTREAFKFDGAEMRSSGTSPFVHCDITPEGVFSPGRWYINVRRLDSDPTPMSFCLTWFGPHNHT